MSGALTSLCRVTRVRTFPSNSFYARFLPRFSCDICAMKLLEYTSQAFSPINDFLRHVNLGAHSLKGSFQAYSCKNTKKEKKLSLSLENENLLNARDSEKGFPKFGAMHMDCIGNLVVVNVNGMDNDSLTSAKAACCLLLSECSKD
ncbi:unnamed protein product [Cuscuta epithymum]|uniref:Uncharacterized protein n=1 Tax=Cuscuta epithymum TaxID=186058 RepID=A0AAV0C3K3_9ASTE|nr:unnamed protein product [Cuscuta epithymum]